MGRKEGAFCMSFESVSSVQYGVMSVQHVMKIETPK